MKIGYFILASSYSVVGSVALLLLMNPMQYASEAQKAILSEYDGLYCTPAAEARKNPLQHSAVAAAMSRIVVKTNLGSLALAEYVKCKVGQ